ncbi:MAG: hypothetical protein KGK44_11695, partial [Gammaproteobacteria bacterium]|nr:hypothetical protein [Gammaproteobacteria bacterium]
MKRGLGCLLVCLVCFAITANAGPSQTTSALLTVRDLFRGDTFRDAVLNPDGNLVLAVTYTDEKHQFVTLMDLDTETSFDIVKNATKEEYFGGLQWISADTAYFVDYINDYENRLVIVKWHGIKHGKPLVSVIPIKNRPYGIVDPLMRDGKHFLVDKYTVFGNTKHLYIYLIDPTGGPEQMTDKTRLMEVDKDTDYTLTDRNGKLLMIMTQDKQGVRHFKMYGGEKDHKTIWTEFKKIKDQQEVFSPIAF